MSVSLTQRVRNGVIWQAVSVLLNQGLWFVRWLVIARFLAPSDVGLFSLASSALLFWSALTNVGLETALLARPAVNEEERELQLHTIWTAELGRRLLMTLLLLASSFPIARFYHHPQLAPLMAAMSLLPLIQGFQNIGLMQLRQQLSFGRLAWFDQISGLIATVVFISLTLWLRNVWATVAAQLLSTALSAIVSYAMHPFRPRLRLDQAAFHEAFHFGKWRLIIGVAGFVITSVDNIVLGKLRGAAVLGVYAVAYNLASMPIGVLGNILSSVLFPAYAELKTQPEQRLADAYVRAFSVGSAMLITILVPIFTLAEEIILRLYGAQWAAAGAILRMLMLLAFCRGYLELLGPFLVNLQGLAPTARIKVIEGLLFFILIYPMTSKYGAMGAAWVGVLTYFVTLLNRLWAVRGLSRAAFKPLPRIISLTAVTGVIGVSAGLLALKVVADTWLRLIVGGSFSMLVTALIMICVTPELRRQVAAVRQQVRAGKASLQPGQ